MNRCAISVQNITISCLRIANVLMLSPPHTPGTQPGTGVKVTRVLASDWSVGSHPWPLIGQLAHISGL